MGTSDRTTPSKSATASGRSTTSLEQARDLYVGADVDRRPPPFCTPSIQGFATLARRNGSEPPKRLNVTGALPADGTASDTGRALATQSSRSHRTGISRQPAPAPREKQRYSVGAKRAPVHFSVTVRCGAARARAARCRLSVVPAPEQRPWQVTRCSSR